MRQVAALALLESGLDAALVVWALANLCGEDDSRISSLRALEAIGPASRSALP